ncbi:S2545 protein, partial [Amia calva]|nr:S2545 protein [Amia calva]
MAFPVLTIAISNSVAFGTYSNALDYLMQSQRSDRGSAPSSLAVYLAGCLAGAAIILDMFVTCMFYLYVIHVHTISLSPSQVVVMAPVDLVKVRLQNQTEGCRGEGRYRGPVHCVASILRQEGPRGLFRGMGALALRDVPCYGLYFLPYEVICTALTKPGQETGPLAVAFAGGTAGVVTWGCATPMDVVKARLQMDGQGGRQYRGVLHCVVASVRAEGVAVLFRGLLLNSLRAFPVNAITFLSYESLLRAMTSAH